MMMICGVDVVGTVACGEGALGHGRYIKNETKEDPKKDRFRSDEKRFEDCLAGDEVISPQWTSILNTKAP